MKKAIIICLAAILITALCLPTYAALNNGADENTPYLSISSGGVTIYPDAGIFWRGVCDPESGAWLEEEYGPGAEGVKSVPLIRYKGEITENSVSYTVYVIEGYESPNGSMEIEYIDRFLKRAGKGVYRITAHFSVTDSEHNTYFQYEAPFDVEVENDPVYNGEYDVVQDGISYLDCGAYCEIVYAAGSLTGDVVIPSSVNINGRDLPVRSVQKQAFQNAEYIKSVVLPDGLTTIGISAFRNCKSLQSITVPESVTSIGTGAFNNCGQLKSITIPENIKKIESHTFFCCSSLESITIPGNVTKIDQFAFGRCTGLTSIDIPDSVTEIMESAFENCTGVKTVTVGSGLRTMHRKAFSGCDAVDTLIISEDNPTYYSKGNCFISKNMNGVVMVFKNSVIPEDENITSIDGSLYNYRSEKVIRIPANIKLIDHAAFYECSSLETVYYGGTIDQWENVVIGSYNKYLRRATIVCTNGKVIGDEEFYDTDDTPEDPDGKPIKGDCSGDGAVDNKDVVILFRYVSGTGKTGDESVYDFNGDGEINNKDVAALFRALSAENAPGKTNEKQITEIIHYNVQTYAFGENGEGYREPEYEGKELIKPVEKSKKDGMDDKTLHIFGKDYTLKYGETYDYGLYDEKYDQYYGSGAWFMFGEKTG